MSRKPRIVPLEYKPEPIKRPGEFVDHVSIPIIEIQSTTVRCPRCQSELELRVKKDQP